MKYHLETIPIWDAFRSGGECPLCTIRHKLESDYLDTALGGAAMEPDIRLMTNEKGFCLHHLEMLYAMRKRLPLALMLHTHLQQIESELNADLDTLTSPDAPKSTWLRRAPDEKERLSRLRATVAKHNASCMVCDQISANIDRYLYTVVYLHKTDPSFAGVFRDGKGFCLPHFEALLASAEEHLSGGVRQAFLRDACEAQKKALSRLDDEVQRFIKMFDFRNAGGDFGTAKDAVPRLMGKLRGEPSPISDGISTL